MLLDAGHDVNAMCDDPGWRHKTPLSAAVDGNEPLAVRLLLRRGANPNLQDGDGDRYPLHWASAFGDHDECAELLVHAGASIDARDANGLTPLEFAQNPVSNGSAGLQAFTRLLTADVGGRPKVEAVLLRAAADSGRPAWSAEHAAKVLTHSYWKAAASGDLRTIERCLKQRQPVDQARPASKARMSALSLATYNGHLEAMRLLIDAKADVSIAEGEGGFTPLHFAVHDRDGEQAARLLLEAGADPFAAKKDGETALEMARRTGRDRAATLLHTVMERQLKTKALVDALSGDGWLVRPSAARLSAAIEAAVAAQVTDAPLLARAAERLAQLREEEEANGSGHGGGGAPSAWELARIGLAEAAERTAGGWSWAQNAFKERGAPWIQGAMHSTLRAIGKGLEPASSGDTPGRSWPGSSATSTSASCGDAVPPQVAGLPNAEEGEVAEGMEMRPMASAGSARADEEDVEASHPAADEPSRTPSSVYLDALAGAAVAAEEVDAPEEVATGVAPELVVAEPANERVRAETEANDSTPSHLVVSEKAQAPPPPSPPEVGAVAMEQGAAERCVEALPTAVATVPAGESGASALAATNEAPQQRTGAQRQLEEQQPPQSEGEQQHEDEQGMRADERDGGEEDTLEEASYRTETVITHGAHVAEVEIVKDGPDHPTSLPLLTPTSSSESCVEGVAYGSKSRPRRKRKDQQDHARATAR